MTTKRSRQRAVKRHVLPGELVYIPAKRPGLCPGYGGAVKALNEYAGELGLEGVTLRWWQPTHPSNPRKDVDVRQEFRGRVDRAEPDVIHLSTDALRDGVTGRDTVIHELRHLWQLRNRPYWTRAEMEKDAAEYVIRKTYQPKGYHTYSVIP